MSWPWSYGSITTDVVGSNLDQGGGGNKYPTKNRGRRGRDHMVVGFTTTYAISDVVSSNLDQGDLYNIMW
jgi:hypothetical protein